MNRANDELPICADCRWKRECEERLPPLVAGVFIGGISICLWAVLIGGALWLLRGNLL